MPLGACREGSIAVVDFNMVWRNIVRMIKKNGTMNPRCWLKLLQLLTHIEFETKSGLRSVSEKTAQKKRPNVWGFSTVKHEVTHNESSIFIWRHALLEVRIACTFRFWKIPAHSEKSAPKCSWQLWLNSRTDLMIGRSIEPRFTIGRLGALHQLRLGDATLAFGVLLDYVGWSKLVIVLLAQRHVIDKQNSFEIARNNWLRRSVDYAL